MQGPTKHHAGLAGIIIANCNFEVHALGDWQMLQLQGLCNIAHCNVQFFIIVLIAMIIDNDEEVSSSEASLCSPIENGKSKIVGDLMQEPEFFQEVKQKQKYLSKPTT